MTPTPLPRFRKDTILLTPEQSRALRDRELGHARTMVDLRRTQFDDATEELMRLRKAPMPATSTRITAVNHGEPGYEDLPSSSTRWEDYPGEFRWINNPITPTP